MRPTEQSIRGGETQQWSKEESIGGKGQPVTATPQMRRIAPSQGDLAGQPRGNAALAAVRREDPSDHHHPSGSAKGADGKWVDRRKWRQRCMGAMPMSDRNE